MEFNDIKAMWEVYDKKIDHLENMNKRIIQNLYSQKTTSFLNKLHYKYVLGIVAIPIIFTYIIWPVVAKNTDNPISIIGVSAIVIVFLIQILSNILLLRQALFIKLEEDPIIMVQRKIVQLKKMALQTHQVRNYTFPILAGGFVLTFWSSIPYTPLFKILFFLAITISVYFWGSYKFKTLFKNKITVIEKELEELNTYNRD